MAPESLSEVGTSKESHSPLGTPWRSPSALAGSSQSLITSYLEHPTSLPEALSGRGPLRHARPEVGSVGESVPLQKGRESVHALGRTTKRCVLHSGSGVGAPGAPMGPRCLLTNTHVTGSPPSLPPPAAASEHPPPTELPAPKSVLGSLRRSQLRQP